GPDITSGQKLHRRDVRTDGVKVVARGRFGERSCAVGIDHDGRAAELGGPAAVGAAIDHRAIVDAVRGDHDGTGDFYFFLVERRGHRATPRASGKYQRKNTFLYSTIYLPAKSRIFYQSAYPQENKSIAPAMFTACFVLMTGGDGRNSRRILGRGIAAPHHMHIGAQQDEITFVDVPRSRISGIDHPYRRAVIAQRDLQ